MGRIFQMKNLVSGSIEDIMACDYIGGNDRRSMTISVTILGITLCVVFLAYFAFSEQHNDSDVSTIRFAAVVFRHGERSPTGLYPNDPNVNYTWPGGFGALLPRGSLQVYNFGTNLRKRYNRLIPLDGHYSYDFMNVLSSAAERCLMSAQSFLAGFLPPNDKNPYNLPIAWQPVAVNSVPRNQDKVISQKATCSKYDEILDGMYTHPPPELKEFNEKNAELFQYVSKHIGANITSVHQGEQLYNILSIQSGNGLELPEWTKTVFPEKLLALAERNLAVLTQTDYMKRIKGGSFVTDVFNKMQQKKNGTLKPDRTIFIYSGHDVTLVNVMRALNVIDQTSRKPDYSSALYFELHHNDALDNDFEVKIFYRFDSYNNELKQIAIPNCDPAPCSLTNFGKSIEKIIVNDYDESCKKDST